MEIMADIWIGADVWFVWIDDVKSGSVERSYTNWVSGGPDVGEICTKLCQGQWVVTSCSHTINYICEMEGKFWLLFCHVLHLGVILSFVGKDNAGHCQQSISSSYDVLLSFVFFCNCLCVCKICSNVYFNGSVKSKIVNFSCYA